MGNPIPGPYGRSNNPGFYYREMEALMKKYGLDAPIRVAVMDSGSKKVEARTGCE